MKNYLQTRTEYLSQIKKATESALLSAPSGSLRISPHGDSFQFYRREDSGDRNGTYLKNEDRAVAQQLAQKDYNQKLLRAANQELRAWNKFASLYPTLRVEDIYDSLHGERKKLVTPMIETDETYIKNWLAVPCKGKEIPDPTKPFTTMQGEHVRSKSEWIIANLLKENGIPYRYEYPLTFSNGKTIYPDFCVLNVRTRREFYWEHFGMMDIPSYAENAIQKISSYQKDGFFPGDNLLITYETKNQPLDTNQVKLIIEHYLK